MSAPLPGSDGEPRPLVIKLGGSCVEDLDEPWWDDLAGVIKDRRVVLVHGWSGPLGRFHPRHGKPTAFLRDRYGNRSRWTTPQVIADIQLVCESVRTAITRKLADRGVHVESVLGSDGLLLVGQGERLWWQDGRLVEIENLVGPVRSVDTSRLAVGDHSSPRATLVTPLARDANGRTVNTDADRAAAALAGSLGATTLVLVTDVPNFFVDGEPVGRLTAVRAIHHRDGKTTGGMRKKLRAAVEAIEGGTPKVVLGNGSVTSMLAGESGTLITH
ncbi:amino acid kinase family protein [Kibdelosporangium aridum]|uniref:Acetylglutamate kinase n=1 Tax=Kibdelosporangium aridum TaxID=2030 RepID=A0A1W2G012_KIBAR|nr:acetylglutamate kinase [Kibdelosporangium aridum]SMD27525.1 acetylglutamate kinase [Kibdelosporangium aridum]